MSQSAINYFPAPVPGSVWNTPQTLTSGATVATNVAIASRFRLTAAHNFTLSNPTGVSDGQLVEWQITQDGTGSRVMTLDTKFVVPAGMMTPVLSTAAGSIDILWAIYDLPNDKWRVVSFVKGTAFALSVALGGTGRMDGTLYDNAGTPRQAVNWYSRTLDVYNGGSRSVLDWANLYLNDNGATQVRSVDWHNRYLYRNNAGSPVVSLDWSGMYLSNASANALNWGSSKLIDNSTVDALRWNSRALVNSSNQVVAIWDTSKLYDVAAAESIDWEARNLMDSLGNDALNYNQRKLLNASEATTVNWDSTKLYKDDGSTEVMDWDAKSLSGKWVGQVQPSATSLSVSAGTVATNADNGDFFVVAASGAFMLSNPTGTKSDGQKVTWRFNNDGTGVITYGADFRHSADLAVGDCALTATNGKSDYMTAIWDSTDSKWDIVAFNGGF